MAEIFGTKLRLHITIHAENLLNKSGIQFGTCALCNTCRFDVKDVVSTASDSPFCF